MYKYDCNNFIMPIEYRSSEVKKSSRHCIFEAIGTILR